MVPTGGTVPVAVYDPVGSGQAGIAEKYPWEIKVAVVNASPITSSCMFASDLTIFCTVDWFRMHLARSEPFLKAAIPMNRMAIRLNRIAITKVISIRVMPLFFFWSFTFIFLSIFVIRFPAPPDSTRCPDIPVWVSQPNAASSAMKRLASSSSGFIRFC